MNEIELKYRIDTVKDKILSKLNSLENGIAEKYEDVYFFNKIVVPAHSQKELRVRRVSSLNSQKTFLTYKGEIINQESESKSEYEINLSDFDKAIELLHAMGFETLIQFTKECVNWTFKNYFYNSDMLVTLVEVPEISGSFLEIEICISDCQMAGAALAEIKNFALSLGLDKTYIEKELYTDAVKNARIQSSK